MKGASGTPAASQQPAAAPAAQLLLSLLLLLPALSQAATQTSSNAPYGAYLGCFSLSRLLYMRGVEGKEGKQFTADTIRQCMPDCKYNGYSISIITPAYRCWCAISMPDVQAQLSEAACAASSELGAAVFYHHEFAGKQKCRLEALPLTPDTVQLSSGSSATFNAPARSLTLGLLGSSSVSQAAVKGSSMLYGQVEVTAMVNAAMDGFNTAFDLQSSSSSSSSSCSTSAAVPSKSGDRISFQFVTGGSPPVANSVLLGSATRGAVMGEALIKPGDYQKRLNLGWGSRTNNTFIEYTISWQSSRVTYAMEGVPLATRKAGQEVKWTDASGKQLSAIFASPSQPASVHFSVWSSQAIQQQQQQQQQPAMLPNGLPALSQFTGLKRIEASG
ncbi:hypothetical protein OEZ86_002355 [Tetradesmus obliquus]|nr:hypothetical protein OEZ86_002355 [Tetradesmus obliquus]